MAHTPQISLKEARDANAALRAQLAQGIDPLAKRKAEKAESQATDAALFSVLTAEWYEQTAKAKDWGERHCKKISQQLNKHILPTFGGRDCRTITPKEIAAFIQSIDARGTNAMAHDCFDIIRRIFAFVVQRELRETSPAAHL